MHEARDFKSLVYTNFTTSAKPELNKFRRRFVINSTLFQWVTCHELAIELANTCGGAISPPIQICIGVKMTIFGNLCV